MTGQGAEMLQLRTFTRVWKNPFFGNVSLMKFCAPFPPRPSQLKCTRLWVTEATGPALSKQLYCMATRGPFCSKVAFLVAAGLLHFASHTLHCTHCYFSAVILLVCVAVLCSGVTLRGGKNLICAWIKCCAC